MSTELDLAKDQVFHFPTSTTIATTPDPAELALDRMLKQAEAMSAAMKIGTALADTALVPDIYRGKPGNAAAAILFGAELGLSAIQSLQQVFLVHGKPAIYANTMAALVRAAGHRLVEVEASDESVTWSGQRRGTGDTYISTWTIERARKAGYLSNKKYETNPQQMLRAKAISELCRTMAPEALMGIHTSEDLELDPTPVRVESERVTAVEVLADSGAKPEETQPDPAAQQPSTAAQQRRVSALLDKLGVTEPEAKLGALEEEFQRPFTSSKELTRTEAAGFITFLEAELDRPAPADVPAGAEGAEVEQ